MRFVGQSALQLHGGVGLTDAYPVIHCLKKHAPLRLAFADSLHYLGEVSKRTQGTTGVFT